MHMYNMGVRRVGLKGHVHTHVCTHACTCTLIVVVYIISTTHIRVVLDWMLCNVPRCNTAITLHD